MDAKERDIKEIQSIVEDVFGKTVQAFKDNPQEAFKQRGVLYYGVNKDNIIELLRNAHVEASTIKTVLNDYFFMLCGVYYPSATVEQIDEVLTKVKPYKAFFVDKDVFYSVLMIIYIQVSETYQRYKEYFTDQTDVKKKATYLQVELDRFRSGSYRNAFSVIYLTQNNYITLQDLLQIDIQLSTDFFNYINVMFPVDTYIKKMFIGQYAFKLTEQELAAIEIKDNDEEQQERLRRKRSELKEDAERINAITYKSLVTDKEKAVLALVEAENEKERTQAQKQFLNGTIQIPQTFSALCSRGVYASTDKEIANNILPIGAFINDYLQHNHITDYTITPFAIERTIEGVNLLQKFKNIRPINGTYTLEFNISELADLCYGRDASDDKKKDIMTALKVLNDLYVVLWGPKGRYALRLLSIRKIGLTQQEKGNIVIDIYADAMKGRPNLISGRDFEKMRKELKGQTANHFRNQIMSKGHKEEQALLDEVFGYTVKLDEQKDNPEQYAIVKDYIRKHKSRDKQSLKRMFERYAKEGFISYTITKNAKGQTIYSWDRLNTPQDNEQEPDEQ